MSKRVRTIIIAAALAFVLVAAVLIVSFLPEKGHTHDSSGSGDSSSVASGGEYDDLGYISVYSFNVDQIRRMDIKNQYGEYSMKYVKKDEYCIEGMEEYVMDSSAVDEMLMSCMQFAATKVIAENPKEFAPYELDEPAAEVKLTYDTGEMLDIKIGGQNAEGSRYIYIKNNDKIYLVDPGWSTVFEVKYSYFLDMTVVDDFETDENGNEIKQRVKKISYFGKGLETPIILEENPEYIAEQERLEALESDETADTSVNAAQYIFTSPFKADASNDSFSGHEYDYFGLYASDIYSPNPTKAQLKKCGLDDPYMNIEIVTSKETITLKLGNTVTINGTECYYVLSSQKKAIFAVETSDFSFFKEDMINYISAIVVNVVIDDIDTLTIERGKDKYVFETSGDGDDLVVRWEGKKMSTTEFRDLYQLVMLAYCEESVKPNEYKGDAEIKITYTYRDREKVDVVEYVKAGTRKYLIRLNGSDLALVRSKYVDRLVSGVTEFVNGRDVPSDYI